MTSLENGLEKKIIYVSVIVLKGMFVYTIRKCILYTLRCRQFSDLFKENVNNSGMSCLLSCVTCVWNLHKSSIIQTIQEYHKLFTYVCYLLLHFVCTITLLLLYVCLSSVYANLLKYYINNYCNIWPNWNRSH